MARDFDGQKSYGGMVLPVAAALIAMAGQLGQGQTRYISIPGPPIVAGPAEIMPTYEVATIKPGDEKAVGVLAGMPLRIYIQGAFGISFNAEDRVIGPNWISSATYVVQGKPPDSISDAMKTMSAEQRRRETGLMKQSLLADRFKLKAHWETREMPVYELVPAKDGPKLTEVTDLTRAGVSSGSSVIRAKAVPMSVLINVLEGMPDIGGRTILDKTGLTGSYDITLKWAPMEAAAAPNGRDTAATPDAQGDSLFTAIEEQLGLKLVPAKGPEQVVVIDHIEKPSEN
jgi:uncharacterized protein (TIGR03435 family)